MRTIFFKKTTLFFIASILAVFTSVFAKETSIPKKAQEQSKITKSVQTAVENDASNKASQKRQSIMAEALEAVRETQNALKLLDENKTQEALKSLAVVTGKLELILARDPKLALAPINAEVLTYDLLANPITVEAIIKDARDYLNDGEIQKARPLVASLASEIVFRTTSIPLATYPAAIKAIVPLIDNGKVHDAKAGLQAALNTLVITTDGIIPLPVKRAEKLLEKAEKLAENIKRTEEENKTLSESLKNVKDQLKMAELLGYGTKKNFKSLYEQLDKIEEKSSGGKGGAGWFDKIKKQVSELF